MESFKFLHSADIHLDSPLRGLSRYEGVPAEAVRTATRDALNNLVDAAIEQKVAFLIIAGDLYDGDWDDFGTGLFFCAAMGRLERSGINVYLLFGNHDAASQLTKRLPLPPNVRVFDHGRPQSVRDERTGCVLHGQSYRERDPGCSLAASYPPAEAGAVNIGVLHTALTGGDPQHAPYSPCTPADLATKGYDYWALGHVHRFQVVTTEPFIVFPGNLQGRSIRETGPKGAALVTVEESRIAQVEHLSLDAVRWASVDVDLSSVDEEAELESRLRAALQEAYSRQADGRPLMGRVRLVGTTSLHSVLKRKRDVLREEVRAIAAAISEEIWVEKVKVETRPQTEPNVDEGGTEDIALLFTAAASDGDLTQLLRADFADLCSRLPPDLADQSEVLQAVQGGDLDLIIREAAETLRVRLGERRA